MRVKCPDCSREYNVAEKNLGKQLKCLCGIKFSAEPFLTTGETENIDTSFYEDETKDEDFSLVSGEMNDFISNLKEKRKSVHPTNPGDNQNDVKITEGMFDPPSLEISEDGIERKRLKKEAAEAKQKEETTVSSKAPDEGHYQSSPNPFTQETSPHDEVPAFEAISSNREGFHDEKSISRRVSSVVSQPNKRVMIIAGSLFAIALTIAFASINIFEQEVEQDDPYLSKLLAPKQDTATKSPEPVKIKEKVPAPAKVAPQKQIAKPKPKPKKKNTVSQKKRSVSIYQKLYRDSIIGNYENVVRLGSQKDSLGPNSQALFLEALAQRASGNLKRQKQIEEQIKESIRAYNTESSLRRAQAAQMAIIPRQNAKVYQQAIEALKNLSLTRNKDPFVHAYLGLAYSRVGDFGRAHRSWNEARHLAPNYRWVLIQQYDLYVKQKQYDLAIKAALDLEKIPNSKIDALKRMARIRSAQKKYKSAESLYLKALLLKDTADVRLERGQNLMNTSLKSAQTQFQTGLRLTKDSRLKRDLYFNLGKVHCRQANYSEADRAYRNSFRQDKTYVRALFESGTCAYKAKQYSRAAKAYESILKVNPQSSEAWYSYGISLKQTNKVKAAAGALERSVKLKPTFDGHYQLSLVLLSLGQKKEASIHAYRAYRLNPNSQNAKALLSKLQ